MSKDVAAWLEGIGLGSYIPSFLENALDFDTIPLLTDSELRELGLPIGLRIKLKEAARRLGGGAPAEPPDTLASADTQRYIYALFCDIADSTALVNRLGSEGFHELLRSYQRACIEPITKYDGFIDECQGDGILALFGFPQAHDHAADFAVRAGMEIVRAVRRIREPVSPAVRVGIGCGECAISETDRGRMTAVGSAKYIAARLQSSGTPNQVYICRTTNQALSKRFVREKETVSLKGFEDPQDIYRVVDVREAATRFSTAPGRETARDSGEDVRPTVGLTPFVGRRSELALLKERWIDVRDRGIGRAQYICGDPGVGKSRIVHELDNWIAGTRYQSIRFQCLPYASQSPLFPVIQQITQLSGIRPTDTTSTRRERLATLLSRAELDRAGRIDLLVDLLSLDDESHRPPSRLPQHFKAHTLGTLVDMLYERASRAPLLCVVEDAQWIDPSTQELLDLAVSNVESHAILLLVTHRPDYRHRGLSLPLQLFVKPEVEEMLDHLLGQRELPHPIRERILAERIPLHIEEIARWAASADVNRDFVVPASLRDSLMARLDRAPRKSRQIVEIASVIGQKFSLDVLQHVSGMAEQDLLETLENLRQNEIIEPMEASPSSRFRFFHALLCDAAYELVTRSRKTEYHRRVAEYLETSSASASQPELLARHYAESGDFPRSIDNWIKGAERARKRYANAEAEGHLRCAEQLLKEVAGMEDRDRRLTLVEDWMSRHDERSQTQAPDTRSGEVAEQSVAQRLRRADLFVTKRQLTVQSMLGACCVPLHQYSSQKTRIALEQALSLHARARAMEADLCIEHSQSKEELQAMFGLWGHFWMTAQHDRALDLARQLLSRGEQLVAQQAADSPSPHHQVAALLDVVAGHRSLGCTLFTLGDFAAARHHLEATVNSVIPDGPGDLIVDPRLAAHLMLAWMLWILGEADLALTHVEKAVSMAQASQDPYSQAFALYVASAVHLMREEYERSLSYAEESLAVSRKYSIQLYELYSLFGRGCANARLGRTASGLDDLRKGIRMAEQTNLRYMRAFMLGWRAEIEADEGDIGAANASIGEAFTHIGDVAGRAWEAELHRIAGRLALLTLPPNRDAAKQSFAAAREIAQRQGARSIELRATTALARLISEDGETAQARALLEAAIQVFEGSGQGTPDLLRARRQLYQCTGQPIGQSNSTTTAR